MEKIFDKISSYNLFNYLFPGIVFGWIFVNLGFIILPVGNIFAVLVAAYALGLLISRVGSLILEPLLKRSRFISFANYEDYVRACDTDKKIELFVEQANSYRTILAGFVLTIFAYPAVGFANWLQLSEDVRSIILIALGGLIFAWSYKKQSEYVSKRVAARSAK